MKVSESDCSPLLRVTYFLIRVTGSVTAVALQFGNRAVVTGVSLQEQQYLPPGSWCDGSQETALERPRFEN